ncbi:YigZ family protein [Roseovarius sp. TE539]|uniref:YigZ family protein n=1 Tax=Roseovarius sp. TE539 TaxID=2249812 RepID=UPI000DDDB3CC|nr:YigZ family protein [Roseovarius sp. TE539]RBI75743.1 YigZ family protein [Roseovarius sp. TE539]
MRQLMGVVSDRGSRYAVSGGEVTDNAGIEDFLKTLKRKKKFARATHNSWAAVLSEGTSFRADDGETGASILILQMLERSALSNHIVVVTRWYGGKHLGGDRFRHVQACVRAYLADLPV